VADNEEEVKGMGYKLLQIGSHSIRKGAAAYLTSMPDMFIFSIQQ
jgi:hypothetical protein